MELNKRTANAARTLFTISKSDWNSEELLKVINNLTYDDILDFAEYIEESHLSSALQKECCDTVLRIEDVTKYTKQSLIFHIIHFRDPVRVKYGKNEIAPSYQNDW